MCVSKKNLSLAIRPKDLSALGTLFRSTKTQSGVMKRKWCMKEKYNIIMKARNMSFFCSKSRKERRVIMRGDNESEKQRKETEKKLAKLRRK